MHTGPLQETITPCFAFLALQLDVGRLPGCLGFHIIRKHLDQYGKVIEERPLASYVAFEGQRIPGDRRRTRRVGRSRSSPGPT